MTEEAGQVTLIFYKLGERWWKEPFLNIVAAAAQMSSFTHVELAIGSDAGTSGEMTNVARVFNDDVGVELTARTGRNPQYSYLQLGCSKAQELAMLRFAKSCVGKPFSGTAMARSVIWPRRTNGTSFFCAELVAAVLKEGGLLDPVSNPGAATPQGLHELYRGRATTTANPYLLRQANCQRTLTTHSVVQERHYTPPALQQAPVRMARTAPARSDAGFAPARSDVAQYAVGAWSASGTGRGSALRVLNEGTMHSSTPAPQQLGITLNSLNFRSAR